MNLENEIGFSVITPVFNREDCIRRCIESVINQQYGNVEHWIVDDGSTDNTYSIIKEYATQYPTIKYHKFEQNKGVNAARNYAIKNSSKDFAIILDSDDYFVENALSNINKEILANPEYRHYLFAQDDRLNFYDQHALLKAEKNVLSFSDFLSETVSGDFVHIIETALLQGFPFDENLRIYEDLTFFKIYKTGEKQLFIKQIVVNRERNRSDSVTKKYRLNNFRSIEEKSQAIKTQLKLFEEDYRRYDKTGNIVMKRAKEGYALSLALRNQPDLIYFSAVLEPYKLKISWYYRLINKLHLGACLGFLICFYSTLKAIWYKQK
jgi:glycosyltransferase involved in cell wall biosynthesis